jgi:signal recognition particle subunit SRP54
MGDVLSLIERAEQAVAVDEQAEMEERMLKGRFSFEDFLRSYKMMRRMGSLKGLMGMIPGLPSQLKDADVDERQLVRVEAVVLSMTLQERRRPEIIDGKRRLRISRGSGTTVQQVNQVLEMRKQMERMLKQMNAGGKMRLPGQGGSAASARKATKARRKRRRR